MHFYSSFAIIILMTHKQGNDNLERLRGTLKELLTRVERNVLECAARDRMREQINAAIASNNPAIMRQCILSQGANYMGREWADALLKRSELTEGPQREPPRIDGLPTGPITDDIIKALIGSGEHARSGLNRGARKRLGRENEKHEGPGRPDWEPTPLKIMDPVLEDMMDSGPAGAEARLIYLTEGAPYIYTEDERGPALLGRLTREFGSKNAKAALEYYKGGNEHYEKVWKYGQDDQGDSTGGVFICFYEPIGEFGDPEAREKFNRMMSKKRKEPPLW